ncbi:MAG: hypothetical protein M3R72_12385 [Bacteroidota bacterium]|nr:hypothetical protein [Bacteroidota bacterium]
MKLFYAFTTVFVFASKNVFCQYDSLKPKGIYTSNFIINEIPRNLTYYMPQNYGKFNSYPLLIVLHDEKSSAMNVIKKWGDLIHAKADFADCVVMYPDAVDGVWKKGKNKDSLNDRMFLNIMLNFFIQQYHCDDSRIYLLGIGAGSEVAYQFSCEKNSKITAIATIGKKSIERSEPICADKKELPVVKIINGETTQVAIDKAIDFLLPQKK